MPLAHWSLRRVYHKVELCHLWYRTWVRLFLFWNIISLETSIKINISSNFTFWSYDFLTIFDGGTIFDNKIDEITGDSLPNSYHVLSTTNKLLLSFESDESETRVGFSIQYESSKLLSDCLYQILELYLSIKKCFLSK